MSSCEKDALTPVKDCAMGWTQSRPIVTARDRAILEVKVQRDRLKQYTIRVYLCLHIASTRFKMF